MVAAESTLLVWSAIACGIAALLLCVGIRGRRIDDHPLCRKCGFDLFGLPTSSGRCPECGRELGRRRSVRVGHRRRRRGVLMAATPLLLLGGGTLGALGYAKWRGLDVYKYKPVSWLVREMKYADLRPAAAAELAARIVDGRLDDATLERLVEQALAHQADRSQPWIKEWGGFVEVAAKSKRLRGSQ